MRVQLSEPAASDVDEIVQYLFERNPRAAARFTELLSSAMKRLGEHPFSGRSTSDVSLRMTGLPKFGHRVFYSVDDDVVTIHHVRHGARDMPGGIDFQ